MALFYSEQTITDVYHSLTRYKFEYSTEFFYLLILKHAGITAHKSIDLNSEEVKSKIIEATRNLSWLYLNEDNFNDKKVKYNFINPFSMKEWGNNPSEAIIKWAPARLVNNVTGGGKQWKSILTDEDNNPNIIRLKHDYLEYFSKLKIKYPLTSLAIWLTRFNSFGKEQGASSLGANFYEYFNVTEEEKAKFFTTKSDVVLKFSDTPTSPQVIRELIGSPESEPNWVEKSVDIDFQLLNDRSNDDIFIKFVPSNDFNLFRSISDYKNILDKADQALLMGPPGTSKSFVASALSEKFDKVKRLQFHPQYTYQDFIGGKILSKGNLIDKKGEFLVFLEEAISNQDKSYLLIIEEINRANVSQVFGELIQLLDRNEKLTLTFNDLSTTYYLPSNLKIVGTMNTTDRTVGRIDYAVKRRFYQIYFSVDYNILTDKVELINNLFSISDLMRKINSNLITTLNNKEMVVGHAILMKSFVFDSTEEKFKWNLGDFADLFNFVIVPIIEDYCNGNSDMIASVIGNKLPQLLQGDEFGESISEYILS